MFNFCCFLYSFWRSLVAAGVASYRWVFLLAVICHVSNAVCLKDAVNLSTSGGRRPGGLGALRWRVYDQVTRIFHKKMENLY